MSIAKAALFLSGLFFGGLIDHVILALAGFETTPFGVAAGVMGNWLFAGLDAGIAALLLMLHLRLERARQDT